MSAGSVSITGCGKRAGDCFSFLAVDELIRIRRYHAARVRKDEAGIGHWIMDLYDWIVFSPTSTCVLALYLPIHGRRCFVSGTNSMLMLDWRCAGP